MLLRAVWPLLCAAATTAGQDSVSSFVNLGTEIHSRPFQAFPALKQRQQVEEQVEAERAWQVDPAQFPVLEAVPGRQQSRPRPRFREHVFMLEEVDTVALPAAARRQQPSLQRVRQPTRPSRPAGPTSPGRRPASPARPAAPTPSRQAAAGRPGARARSCQSRCVQRSCLPVTEIPVFSACVEKCKKSCEQFG